MKNGTQKLLFCLLFSFFALSSFAQQEFGPQWGENATQDERRQNVLTWNYYKDAYEAKNYDLATSYLPSLLENSPGALQNIYVYGITIYKNKFAQARTVEDKRIYADSVFMLYDMRIKYFGDNDKTGRPYILKFKARDYLSMKPTDREGIREVFAEAVDANANDVDAAFNNIYFKELTDDYLNEEIETDEYLEAFEKLSELLDKVTGQEADDARKTFDALFLSSGAADCDNLEKLFKAKFQATPNDPDLVSKTFAMLSRGNCFTDFYLEVGEKYFALQPTANTAIVLANGFEKAGQSEKSQQYLREAMQAETDPLAKSNLSVQLAGLELRANNGRTAADYARQAISFYPENGYAYIILASAYVVGSNGCSDSFDRQTVYWLAYDTLMNARRIFSDDAEQLRSIDQSLANYRSGFPSQEECFFRGLNTGSAYNVNCGWVSGRTTVKEGR